jgi:hypothetical protein
LWSSRIHLAPRNDSNHNASSNECISCWGHECAWWRTYFFNRIYFGQHICMSNMYHAYISQLGHIIFWWSIEIVQSYVRLEHICISKLTIYMIHTSKTLKQINIYQSNIYLENPDKVSQ